MNEELLKLQYEYAKMHHDNYFIYPKYWFEITDDDRKIKVLKQAIKEKKLIIDVKGGSYFQEGVILSTQ